MAAAFNAQGTSLSIANYRSGQQLACVKLKAGEFALSFIHSVSLTRVEDVYQIQQQANGNYLISQTEERFVAHGHGLPSMETEPDVLDFEHRDGRFILHLDRAINNLIVRLDRRFNNRLDTGQRLINLNQWPDDIGLHIQPTASCE